MRIGTVLLIILAASCLSVPAIAAERYALLIGNENYKPANSSIGQAPHDIQLLETALELIGFQVIAIKDADQKSILSMVGSLAQQLSAASKSDPTKKGGGQTPAAIGLVYYSGHAHPLVKEGPNYLIPTDIDSFTAEQIQAKGVELGEMLKTLVKNAPNAAHFVLIDGGRLVKGFDPYDNLYFGMADEPMRKGILLALSNAPGHGSNGSNEQASIFSSRLAQRLIGDSSDHKQFFKDFKTYCGNQTGNRQIPWIRDGIAQPVSLSASSYQSVDHVTKGIKPDSIVWKKAQGKSAVIFVDWTKLYAEPRVDAKVLKEIQSMLHIEKIVKGTSISIGEMNGRPVWYRFKPVGNKKVWHYAYHGVKLK